ncbi:hypothetical protein CEXT_303141 [Caerostris extrusa]|uniref:Uncharacterized protein n=1 Tax=Caerostris extrusa TaxID=172846 RepID=A0AAV4MCR4_CAEEX|nr:hypothetical protein CEXT_303141 [Caerostris extrusa]
MSRLLPAFTGLYCDSRLGWMPSASWDGCPFSSQEVFSYWFVSLFLRAVKSPNLLFSRDLISYFKALYALALNLLPSVKRLWIELQALIIGELCC